MLPTPTSMDSEGSGTLGYLEKNGTVKKYMTLTDAVVRLPTPTARDGLSVSPGDFRRNTPPLRTLGQAGVLNPQFVEWMMGWPVHWTKLCDCPEE
jgi:hypothetical protein